MEEKIKKAAVLYGGSVGFSLFYDLCRAGVSARIYSANKGNLDRLRSSKVLRITGSEQKTLDITEDQLCSSPAEAIRDAEIIFAACPAFLHEAMIQEIKSEIRGGQVLVLCPGRCFGALHVLELLRNQVRHWSDITVVEMETVPYACRILEGLELALYSRKDQLNISVIGSHKQILSIIKSFLPQHRFRLVPLFQTSLQSVGFIMHPAALALNASKVIESKMDYYFYRDFMTEEVIRVATQIDEEKQQIIKLLGFESLSVLDWFDYSYGVRKKDIKSAIQSIPAYSKILAPKTLEHRYLLEDVPFGLTPLKSIAEELKIDTPAIDRIIRISSDLFQVDLYEKGRRLEKLGLNFQGLKDFLDENANQINESEAMKDQL